MQKLLKNIFTVSYLKNTGARRLCFVLGVLFALIPTYFFLTRLHVNQTTSLLNAVVNTSVKQQKYVFANYPYKCNFCDLETNFDRWQSTFGSWKYANDLKHTDCSKLRDPGSCVSAKKYLAQTIKVSYFNFGAFAFLAYALLVFYVPFLMACAIQWIMLGFQQTKPQKKEKK